MSDMPTDTAGRVTVTVTGAVADAAEPAGEAQRARSRDVRSARGGLQIALGADIRIVAPDARLSVFEVALGLIPDITGLQLLP